MRKPLNIAGLLGALTIALAVASGVAGAAPSTSGSTVAVNVASATTLDASGCASGTLNLTDFGTIFPSTTNVTSSDCSVVFGSSNDTSMLRIAQADGVGTAMVGMSNGSLDTSFDGDGKQITAVGAGNDYAYGVAVQADGKIVLAGPSNNGANDDFAIVRYTAAGALDATFDGDGKQTTAIGAGSDMPRALAVQADGKIVVAGASYNGSNDDVAVVRYNTDGSLDTTFDTDGKLTTAVGASGDRGQAVVLQADGKIVVAGSAVMAGNDDFAVVRYTATGALDTSFDTDGKQTTAIGATIEIGRSVAIQADGKIVVAGDSSNGVDDDFAVVRYTAAGALDTSFDTDGKQTSALLAAQDTAPGLVIQPDGKIVLGGYAFNGTDFDFALARYTTAGALDATFDGDGKQTAAIGASQDYIKGIVLQPDGKIVAAGDAFGGAFDFAVARFTTAGTLDTTFGTSGKVTTPVGAGTDNGYGVALQTDGKLVVAGAANGDFAVVRYGGGGTVADWSGSWAAAGLFGACLHTVANAANTWTLAGNGNCTTAIDANWNAVPTTSSKVASGASGVTNATANLRYGFKATTMQTAGTYAAQLSFEVVAPNA